jgi:NDP-sugar pyrophosphorylase family protein
MSLPLAIILAGGLGSRLRQVVHDRPKVLANVCGRPFLDYVLNYLAGQRVQKVILSVGYLAEQVIKFAGDGSGWNLVIEYSREETPLGTAGALRLASQSLDKSFLALNGDTLYLADLGCLAQQHQRLQGLATIEPLITKEPLATIKPLATIGLLHLPEGQARGCVEISEDGLIHQFYEKPPQNAPSLVNGGIYLLEPHALADLEPGQPASLEREIFPTLAARGQLAGLVQEAYFVDIGVPESLLAFEQDVIHNRFNLS